MVPFLCLSDILFQDLLIFLELFNLTPQFLLHLRVSDGISDKLGQFHCNWVFLHCLCDGFGSLFGLRERDNDTDL